MEADESSKFNARQLVNSFMESSFESDPEAWAEIISVEKKLEYLGILTRDAEGQYSSPQLLTLKDALEKYRKGEASLSSIVYVISSFQENIEKIKTDVEKMSTSSSDSSYIEHINDVNRTTHIFHTMIKNIKSNLEDEPMVSKEIEKVEEYISLKTVATKEDKESTDKNKKGQRTATTFYMASGGEGKGIKIFSSPSYDLIRNALSDYRDGYINDSQCIKVINDVKKNIDELYDFFDGELNIIREDDPESYSRYKEVVLTLAHSRKSINDGIDKLLAGFDSQKEESPDGGMEIFFKGIQEMAVVWRLLDQIKDFERNQGNV